MERIEMKNNSKIFELVDTNIKIPISHKCHFCDFILFDVFECEDRCGMYCKEHLPENKKCGECDGDLHFNKDLTNKIKEKYMIICTSCSEQMMLKDLRAHLKDQCKKESVKSITV